MPRRCDFLEDNAANNVWRLLSLVRYYTDTCLEELKGSKTTDRFIIRYLGRFTALFLSVQLFLVLILFKEWNFSADISHYICMNKASLKL
jgi:hypothetical protein